MSAVFDFVEDVGGGVVDAVGDVVETVGDVISDSVEFVGDAVEAVVNDPIPTLLAIAGQSVGIPAPVTMAAVTAARGGDIENIVLAAGTAYISPMVTNAISSTLSSAIGESIVNQAVSDTVVNGISKGLINGTIAEIQGGDFDDGFAGAFTGTLVTGGVTELTNFVKPDLVDALSDAGLSTNTATAIINAGTRAIGAGVTAEITGRGDFDTAFTNSVINSTATGVANFATNNIAGQFESVISTNNEIVGADEGNVRDDEELATDLANAWENRDINAVNNLLSTNNLTSGDIQTMFDLTDDDITTLSNNGLNFYSGDADTSTTTTLTNLDNNTTFGTGAGINSTLVNEVDTGVDGFDTGDASDVIENDSTKFTSPDMSGSSSVSTISGSDTTGLLGDTEDTVEEIDLSGLNVRGGTSSVIDDINGTFQDEVETDEGDTTPITGGLTAVTPTKTIDTTPIGGLSAIAPTVESISTITTGAEEDAPTSIATRDLLSQVTPDVSAYTETGEKIADIGGLNNLVDQGAKGVFGVSVPGALTGAATGALTSALRQGITKSLQGRITKPAIKTVTRRVPVKTIKTSVPSSALRTAVPINADIKTLRPTTTTKVAPKKVDVRTLSPVTNIAALTSLLGRKG